MHRWLACVHEDVAETVGWVGLGWFLGASWNLRLSSPQYRSKGSPKMGILQTLQPLPSLECRASACVFTGCFVCQRPCAYSWAFVIFA